MDISTDLDNSILEDISMITNNEVWGRLVSLNPSYPHIEISNDTCSFGRAKESDIQYEQVKKISSNHCRIYRSQDSEKEVDSRYFIEDLSTNGTYLNKNKIGKGNSVPLVNGNEISLTSCVDSTDPFYIVYRFQDVLKLRRDEDERQEKLQLTQQDTVPTKLTSGGTEVDLLLTGSSNVTGKSQSLLKRVVTKENLKSFLSKLTTDINTSNSDNSDNNIITPMDTTTNTGVSDIKPLKRKISELSDNESNKTRDRSDNGQAPEKKLKTEIESNENDKKEENDSQLIAPTTTTTTNNNTGTTTATKQVDSSLQENLVCGICHEILYKCITLIPCMHNYCAYCYGECKERSPNCPQCRGKVSFAQTNHTINNLIEALLLKNPEWKRDPEELEDMDKLCKLKLDNTGTVAQSAAEKKLSVWRNRYRNRGYEEDELNEMTIEDFEELDDEYGSEDDEDDDYDNNYSYRINSYGSAAVTTGFPFPLPNFNTCRYCTTPSVSQNGFQCPATGALHQFCAACNQKFPVQTPPPPGVQCKLCLRNFCSAYGPCTAMGFLKQGQVRDHHFTCLPPNTFNGNQYEQKVTQDYLVKAQTNFGNLWNEAITNIENKTPMAQKFAPNIEVTDYVCSNCSNGLFKTFLFEHRLTIDKQNLPDYAKDREDCYYGVNCRTQYNKFDHAKKFNHVCQQKRFH